MFKPSGKSWEAAAYAAGTATGAAVFVILGNMGLATMGTVVSLGLVPVAAVSTVAGLAAYSLKRSVLS